MIQNKLDKNAKIFTNQATKDLSKSLILHQRPQVFTRKEFPSLSPENTSKKELLDTDSILNLRSSLDANFGKFGLDAVNRSIGLSGSDEDIAIHSNNYGTFRKDESMTTFTSSKIGPKITRNDVSQNVFNTLNSVRYSKNASRIQRNSKKTKTVQDEYSESPRPKFKILKSIEE